MLGCHDTATCYDDEVPYCGDHRRRLREYGDPLYRPPQGRRPTITEIPVGVRFLMACYVRKTRAGEDVSPAEMWGMRKYSRIHNGLRRAAALTNAGGTLTS